MATLTVTVGTTSAYKKLYACRPRPNLLLTYTQTRTKLAFTLLPVIE